MYESVKLGKNQPFSTSFECESYVLSPSIPTSMSNLAETYVQYFTRIH